MKIVLALLIRGRNVDLLLRAVQSLVRKHVSLRTLFRKNKGAWEQTLTSEEDLHTEVTNEEDWLAISVPPEVIKVYEDWYAKQGLPESAGRAAAEAITSLKHYPFDLTVELPTRAILIQHEDANVTVLIGIHHAAADAYSFIPITRDIQTFLSGPGNDTGIDFRYLDYASAQARRLYDSGKDQLNYWSRLLSKHPRKTNSSYLDGTTRPCAIRTGELKSQEGGMAARFRQASFMAAFAQALEGSGRLESTYIMTTMANRWSVEDADVVGCFYKHLIWQPPPDVANLSAISTQYTAQSLRSLRNIDVTLDMIIESCNDTNGFYPALDVCMSYRDFTAISSIDYEEIIPVPMLGTITNQRVNYHMHVTAELDRVVTAQINSGTYLDDAASAKVFNDFMGIGSYI